MNSLLKKTATALIVVFLTFTSSIFAQNQNSGYSEQGGRNLLSNSNSLTERSVTRNTTGSCDSTCDAMTNSMPSSAIQSSFLTQATTCGAGYSGSKTQTRNQKPDGTYTPWVDADTSLCVCAPTFQDSTQTCASPQAGTFIRRTIWVCNSNVGAWGAPFTITNNCFTPCSLPSPDVQNSSAACSMGYTGTGYTYQNSATCPGGVGANSTAVWSGWITTSSNCTALPNKLYIVDFLWMGDVVGQGAFVIFKDYSGNTRIVPWDEGSNIVWNTNQKFPDAFPGAPIYPGGNYFMSYGLNSAVFDTMLPPRQF